MGTLSEQFGLNLANVLNTARVSVLIGVVCIGNAYAETVKPAQKSSAAAAWLEQTLTPADARHLLTRTGFDAAPERQIQLAGLTRKEAIDWIMAGFAAEPQRPMPAWTRDVAPLYWTRRDLDQEQQSVFDRLRDSELAQLRNWWVDEMLTTTSPQTERMVLFWHDHFATNYRGINRQSMAMARQNQTFRELGMGNFKTLLTAMIRDPALLHFLNNTRNYKAKPNENLARELLELFTLGEGNYDEATVREAARALTGYSVSQNKNLTARFDHWQHDFNEKTLFEETGQFNGDDLVTLLMKQPALDQFIATRFWHWLVADREPNDNELQPLASAFRASGHELGELYRTVLESESFWHERNRGGIIKSPATLLIGTARALDTPKRVNRQLPRMLKLSGQDLFAPPNVSGWKEGAAWITPGRLLNRYTALEELLRAARKAKPKNNAGDNNENMMSMDQPNDAGMMAEGQTMGGEQAKMAMTQNPSGGADAMHTVSLEIASEEFEGPANYRVELIDTDDTMVWSSEEQTLAGGWDTVRYGRIEGRDQLPWQEVAFNIDPAAWVQGKTLRVHFTNDHAGDAGDRNLFVAALRANDAISYPLAGSQSSFCSPAMGSKAGDLYCAGYVDYQWPVTGGNSSAGHAETISKESIRYASNHIEWVNRGNNGVLHLRLVFQDVRLGQRHWPVFSAWYHVTADDEPQLWLYNDGCWPDCVEQWPPCAWTNEHDPSSRVLSFSAFGARGDEEKACHLNALNDDEALLVDALLLQSTDIISDALAREEEHFPTNRKGIKRGVSAMLKRYQKPDIRQSFAKQAPTGRNSVNALLTWVQDVSAKRPYPQDPVMPPVPLIAHSLVERHQQFASIGFDWNTVLAPGIPVNELPGWDDTPQQKVKRSELFEQVRSRLLNPTYQVY